MKKMIGTVAVSLMMVASASAGKVKDNCGCGLGSMALGEEEGLVSHLAATFLNGICGNQTFGITSGTLGCDQATTIASNKEVKQYINDNMDVLAFDIAAGKGQSLDALADLMKLPADQRGTTFVRWQQNFDTIFAHENISADDVATQLLQTI